MGNCCDKLWPQRFIEMQAKLVSGEEAQAAETTAKTDMPDSLPIQQIPGLAALQLIPNTLQTNMKLVIRQLLPNDAIASLQNHFFDQLSKHKATLQKLKEGSFREFTDAASYAEHVSKERGFDVINVYLQTYTSPYTPDFELFAYLNQEVFLFHSIDQYELVHQEAYEDTIFLVERVRTQKVLVIASRHILALRVIRRLPGSRILDVSQSIELNDLIRFPTLKELYEAKVKEEAASVLVAGRYFEVTADRLSVTTFSKLDFHSSIPLKFAAIFLRRTFDEFFDKLSKNIDIHLSTDVFRTRQQLIWFRSSTDHAPIAPPFAADKTLALLAPPATPLPPLSQEQLTP